MREARTDKCSRSLNLISDLIERYRPDLLVVEDYSAAGSRRCPRIKRLMEQLIRLAKEEEIKIRNVPRMQVTKAFSGVGCSNKHDIATAIAKIFPELAPRVPQYRESYMSEDYRMSIFDAVAFGLTYFENSKKGASTKSNLELGPNGHSQ